MSLVNQLRRSSPRGPEWSRLSQVSQLAAEHSKKPTRTRDLRDQLSYSSTFAVLVHGRVWVSPIIQA